MGDGLTDPLERYVPDPAVKAALDEFGQLHNRTIHVPPQARLDRGWSGATLFVAWITESVPLGRTLTRKVFVKVLPARAPNREARDHHRARATPGEFAKLHIVEQLFPALGLRDGRQLMFQEVANGGDRVRGLDELEGEDLLAAFRAVLEGVLHEWNSVEPDRRGAGLPVHETLLGPYLERELQAADAWEEVHEALRVFGYDSGARTLHIDKRELPNPLRPVDPASTYHRQPISFCYGFSHGDLHGGNVLVPCGDDNTSHPERFSLVDLSTFDEEAPLTRDVAALLLATVLRYVPRLTPDESEALIEYLIRPQRRSPDVLRGPVAQLVRIADEVGTAYTQQPGWTPEWRIQARLSLISQALICTTYHNLGLDGRLWCLRLAARAMEAHRREHPLASSDGGGSAPRPSASGPGSGSGSGSVGSVLPRPPGGQVAPASRQPGVGVAVRAGSGRHRAPAVLPPDSATAPWQLPAATPVAIDPAWPGLAAELPTTTSAGWPGIQPATPSLGTTIPHPRRPPEDTPQNDAPPQRGRSRGAAPHRMIVGLALAVALLAVVGFSAWALDRSGPDGGTSPPDRDVAQSPTPKTPVPLPALTDLAGRVARTPDTRGEGHYAHFCVRSWSSDLRKGTKRQAGSPDRDSFQEEQLWLTDDGAGRQASTTVTDGRRADPKVTMIARGTFTARDPAPAEDPAALRDQLRQATVGTPAELSTPAVILNEVVRFHRYHLLSPDQRSALLLQVADTPGVDFLGEYADGTGRTGLGVTADDSEQRRITLVFDRIDGRLLGYELADSDGKPISYEVLMAAHRTDSFSQERCD
ncbi:hypothetical protein [Micromonospora haikouensis]|uniref:hypothetical protein n=1 Tax=Micromonospora haikouensis TaxID=686309 RepID=UPI003D755B39